MPSLHTAARRHGAQVVDERNLTVQCRRCGQFWTPMLRPGGRLPARWWQCPRGCEADE